MKSKQKKLPLKRYYLRLGVSDGSLPNRKLRPRWAGFVWAKTRRSAVHEAISSFLSNDGDVERNQVRLIDVEKI